MSSWIIGNWKLNPATQAEATGLATDIIQCLNTVQVNSGERSSDKKSQADLSELNDCHIIIAPSFIHLAAVHAVLQNQPKIEPISDIKITLAAQDVATFTADTGAYTGDVSATQLEDVGVQWVILGHSERRQYYNESHQPLLQKLMNCYGNNLGVIFCIGETEEEFEAGQTEQVLTKQLKVIADFIHTITTHDVLSLNDNHFLTTKLIIAYEPVWAIGTGKVPKVPDVALVHQFIRRQLQSYAEMLVRTPILYGGSVKPDNAVEFAQCEVIDGVLVGGASLNADSFIKIATSFGC